ncbi:MAG: ComEC/Rec2 family competence protein, partial [Elusimicrobia bacterium]|nr:ComEC/Rec2 family competence protein [Elusimicrobiota bacterium]
LPLISPLTNLLVVPLAGISIGLGMLVVIVSLVSSKAAMIYGISLSYLIKLLMLITGIVRNAGIGGVTVPRPPGLAAAGICLLLASIGIKRRSLRWKAVIVSIALVLSGTARNLFFARGFLAALSSEKSFSYIIALEPRETVVFDGKNDMDTDAVRSFLYSRGIGKVRDLYIIHPPYEFRKNTLGFIREFGVKRVFWPGTAGNENNWRRFTDLSSGIEIIPVMKGDSMDYGGSRVDILEPCKKYLDIRDNYIQARVTGKERILVYAGGGIPDEKYGYVIVDGAYEPDWPGLEEKRPGTLIFSGEDTPPFKAENIGSKGRIFYF